MPPDTSTKKSEIRLDLHYDDNSAEEHKDVSGGTLMNGSEVVIRSTARILAPIEFPSMVKPKKGVLEPRS